MKFSKINSAVLMLLLLSDSSYAQSSVHIRPEIGMNLAKMHIESNNAWATKDYNTQMKPGIKAGVYFKIYVGGGLFLEPGLLYSMKGFKKKDLMLTTWTIPIVIMKGDLAYTTNNIELPVSLGYDIDLKKGGSLLITAGPYMGFVISGKEKMKFENNSFDDIDHTLKVGSEDDDDIRSLDFGLNIGLGYQSPQGIYFRAQYGMGAANLIPNKDAGDLKNRVLSFSLGYDLPLSKHK